MVRTLEAEDGGLVPYPLRFVAAATAFLLPRAALASQRMGTARVFLTRTPRPGPVTRSVPSRQPG